MSKRQALRMLKPTIAMANVSLVKPQVQDRQARRYWATNDVRWRRLRAVVLAEEPLCRHCAAEGRDTAATEVDHIDGCAAQEHDYRRANLQSLCESCHSVKTARENGGFGKAE